MSATHTSVRHAVAKEAGYIAGLDEMPRRCPPAYIVDELLWLAGYDDAAKVVERSKQALAAVGIGG